MDPHFTLFNIPSHVGGRGRYEQWWNGTNTKTKVIPLINNKNNMKKEIYQISTTYLVAWKFTEIH